MPTFLTDSTHWHSFQWAHWPEPKLLFALLCSINAHPMLICRHSGIYLRADSHGILQISIIEICLWKYDYDFKGHLIKTSQIPRIYTLCRYASPKEQLDWIPPGFAGSTAEAYQFNPHTSWFPLQRVPRVHVASFVVTGGTRGCRYDNLRWHQYDKVTGNWW